MNSGFVMAAAIALRDDYESTQLREAASKTPIKCGGCWLSHCFT